MSDPDRTADWLLSTQGRLARIAFGTALILIGLGVVGGFLGVVLLVIGAVPIASAAYGALLVGPLLGRDTMGRRREDQPKEEPDESDDEDEDDTEGAADEDSSADEANDDDSSADKPDDEDEDSSDAPKADPDWSAPPLARAERPSGQEPRTRDLRAEGAPADPDD